MAMPLTGEVSFYQTRSRYQNERRSGIRSSITWSCSVLLALKDRQGLHDCSFLMKKNRQQIGGWLHLRRGQTLAAGPVCRDCGSAHPGAGFAQRASGPRGDRRGSGGGGLGTRRRRQDANQAGPALRAHDHQGTDGSDQTLRAVPDQRYWADAHCSCTWCAGGGVVRTDRFTHDLSVWERPHDRASPR